MAIKSQPANKNWRDNYDKVFGKKTIEQIDKAAKTKADKKKKHISNDKGISLEQLGEIQEQDSSVIDFQKVLDDFEKDTVVGAPAEPTTQKSETGLESKKARRARRKKEKEEKGE